MSVTKKPWMKLYPADWRADPALRMCDPMARYVWLEMLMIMHEGEPYGHLTINGVPIADEALSRLIDVPVKAVKSALKELGRLAVFSVTDDGIIFSRRMVRDELRATSSRDNGANGGNPALKNQGLSDSQDNPQVKGGVKAQRPEARNQSKEFKEKTEPKGSIKKNSPEAILEILSEIFDADRSKAVFEYRRDSKKKIALTENSARLLVGKLKSCVDPAAAADEMILRGWTSVSQSWLDKGSPLSTAPPKSAFRQHQDECRAAIDREIARIDGNEHSGKIIDLWATTG